MSLPNFDDHAYAASEGDQSWLESDWRTTAAFLSKNQHNELVSNIDDEHTANFMKSATWGQILENNDLPKDGTQLRDEVHAWIGSYHKSSAQQIPVEVEVVEAIKEEYGDGSNVTLKKPKSVTAKRVRRVLKD